MSPVDVLAMVKNLEQRTLAVEQILPTLATKEDLKAFATKEDLKAFATKEDLEAFVTKDDLREALRPFVTKDELKEALMPFATRVEMDEKFEEAKRSALVLHEDLKSDIALIAEHLSDVMTRLPRREES